MPVNICSGSGFAIALCLAGGNDSSQFSEALSQQKFDYECSCSIRKRQQVKARLGEKQKSKQEQSGLGEKSP